MLTLYVFNHVDLNLCEKILNKYNFKVLKSEAYWKRELIQEEML